MNRSLITKNFEDLWREVAPRVEATLRARGTDAHTARDLTQEVAIRLLASDTDFEDEEHVLRWCQLVGRRLAANHYRDQARLLVGVVPERSAGHQPDDVVTGRLAVSEVAVALSRLSDAERLSLLDETSADTRQGRVNQAVRRHRARARLRSMVDGVLVWIAAVPLLRRLLKPHLLAIALVPVALTSLALLPNRAPHAPPSEPFVRPVRTEAAPTTTAPPPPTTTSSAPVPTTVAPPTTTTAPSNLPLAPLHGTRVPLPVENGHVLLRAGFDEPVLCLDDPLLGKVCLLG